ncbi:dTDP-4-dehydrorhamnose reductase [Rhodococcus tibetensis]|uniref:dTDP-4-dehydrorhamnose reductase n=1 Tax=Rhodococcus tibetensis TaxID=2965064 RepID=A0ABT1QGU0_9NOCA|nr:dTDP-4-dehydrorhamnose reductase [Rhodococcus sp. FXJ9.536]MCQ4121466.1 dTDP-4-dehydrorhamnose reductase [Rhodococcus sp. FXJ9.536]
MTEILVTGARGQLGGHLLRRAEAAGIAVRGVGSDELDITDPDAVDAQVEGRSVVINCAAYTAVDAAESDEERALVVNERGPAILAAACARMGARLIHVSTDYVFAGRADTPYEVDAPTAPATAYGRTKLAGERAVHAALPAAHVVRTAWVYSGAGSDFVATMLRLERERDTIDVVNDQVGSPTFAGDLAAALLELAHRTDVVAPILHATNAGRASWYDLARAVFEEVGADPERVRPCSSAQFVRPAPRPAFSVLSQNSWAAAGLTPMRPWRDALRAALTTVV